MRLTSAVPRRAVAFLALLAVWGPGIASRPLPALPFYTGHGLGQYLAEEATLSSQQASHDAELYSQHHGANTGLLQDIIPSQQHYPPLEPTLETLRNPHNANTGLLQDITSHWSSVPHPAHPSGNDNIQHQFSNLQLQGLPHSAEYSSPTFGSYEAGTDGMLFSIPFTQNQYPTVQQPSAAQFRDFAAHPQAEVGYQSYHSFHDSATEKQGFLTSPSHGHLHHLDQAQHWTGRGGRSDGANEVGPNSLPDALSSSARHVQVEHRYPFGNHYQQQAWLAQHHPSAASGTYAPQVKVEHPYPFQDQWHVYHGEPIYGTSAMLAADEQSSMQPGRDWAFPGHAFFAHGQYGTGSHRHGIRYPNQPADWLYHRNAAAARNEKDKMTISEWLKRKTAGGKMKTLPGNKIEQEEVLKRVRQIASNVEWPKDGKVRQAEDISWKGDVNHKSLKEYKDAIRNVGGYILRGADRSQDWAEIAFGYMPFDTGNLIVKFRGLQWDANDAYERSHYDVYRVYALRKADGDRLYLGDLRVPNTFDRNYIRRGGSPPSKSSSSESRP